MDNNSFLIYKILHFTSITNKYIEFLTRIEVNLANLLSGLHSRNKQLKRHLKETLGKEFNNVFPDLEEERIFLLMDLMDKTFFLSDEQLSELVNSIEIVEQ